ncbi:DSD1 family PLP-dependent enzyme [Arenibaculum pallidiluteum]|uniref:DSD1 family PLP-dependent enzyme n=1 Tax=Arenibaculum pallidiluteum TaxID=2812559 RepID=UPI001A964094|nr:DSD1 family PLP-dependent enzyme [Arenibaculum pallidiluteum]
MASFPPGVPGAGVETVETPALVLDLDCFEANLDAMTAWTAQSGLRLRPHAKSHKCSAIALAQIARGAVGVCCQTLGEAEAMAAAGIADILVTNNLVHPGKLQRLARLSATGHVGLLFDHVEQVRRAGEAFAAVAGTCDAYVEIEVGSSRSGVETVEAAVALVQAIERQPGLRFAGVQAYHGRAQHMRAPRERAAAADHVADRVRRLRERLGSLGHEDVVVTGGGTGSFMADAASGALDELQCGSYVFFDVDYDRNDRTGEIPFRQSLFVQTTVLSTPTADRAICDAGLKALSFDSGVPAVAGRNDLTYFGPNDEHGRIATAEATEPVRIGDVLRLVPGHCDPTVAMHDWIVGIRGDTIEALWPIDGRGPR